jgi:hypothetical protein
VIFLLSQSFVFDQSPVPTPHDTLPGLALFCDGHNRGLQIFSPPLPMFFQFFVAQAGGKFDTFE